MPMSALISKAVNSAICLSLRPPTTMRSSKPTCPKRSSAICSIGPSPFSIVLRQSHRPAKPIAGSFNAFVGGYSLHETLALPWRRPMFPHARPAEARLALRSLLPLVKTRDRVRARSMSGDRDWHPQTMCRLWSQDHTRPYAPTLGNDERCALKVSNVGGEILACSVLHFRSSSSTMHCNEAYHLDENDTV